MKPIIQIAIACFALPIMMISAFNSNLNAADNDGKLSIGTVSYLAYETMLDSDHGVTDGSFQVRRSYITVKKSLFKHLEFRITVDAHQDDHGDMKARLKYAYAKFKFDDIAFITKPNIEFGIVHMPWLDFEEHINYYRMQGTMFMERSGLFNSADFGFTVAGYLGGELDDEYKKTVNKKYPGKYGSFAFGVYNGSGYHAKEMNKNKTVEGRLTIRPLPAIIPGLQFSYFGIFGKGNYFDDEIEDFESPDWKTNAFMLSYEIPCFTFTGQYVMGEGNQKGKFVTEDYQSLDLNGFSLFGEGKIDDNWRVIGRYDSFDRDTDIDDNEEQRMIVGVGYDFGHHNILILDFDKTVYAETGKADLNLLKLTMQVKF